MCVCVCVCVCFTFYAEIMNESKQFFKEMTKAMRIFDAVVQTNKNCQLRE